MADELQLEMDLGGAMCDLFTMYKRQRGLRHEQAVHACIAMISMILTEYVEAGQHQAMYEHYLQTMAKAWSVGTLTITPAPAEGAVH